MSQEGVTGVLFVDQHGLCLTGNFKNYFRIYYYFFFFGLGIAQQLFELLGIYFKHK
jgi:hypothetical protein